MLFSEQLHLPETKIKVDQTKFSENVIARRPFDKLRTYSADVAISEIVMQIASLRPNFVRTLAMTLISVSFFDSLQ